MIIYNMGSSILMACGNSKIPFYILILGGITNIIADIVLVAILRYGVVGAAIATSISQTVTAVCMVWYLMSKNSPINVFYKNTKLELYALKEILKYGLPAGIQSVIITVSNVVVQYYINGYGENVVAAYAAYFKIESVIYLPIMACGQAITTFVGQHKELKFTYKNTPKVLVDFWGTFYENLLFLFYSRVCYFIASLICFAKSFTSVLSGESLRA